MAPKAEADRLIEEFLPLVSHVVTQVSVQFPRHVDLGELASAGTMGLVEAAYRYEADRGVPFKHFAGHRIRGAILDFVRKMDWAPRSVREGARKVETARTNLASAMGASPTRDDVAGSLGLSSLELHDIEARASRAVVLSLDEPIGDFGNDDFGMADTLTDTSLLDPSESVEMHEMHGYLRDAVAALPHKHSVVVQGTFLDGRSAQEVADELGISVSRVSQLRTEALEMLRDGLDAQFTESGADEAECKGRVARRTASYAAAIASRSAWRDRIAATEATPVVRAANYA